MSQINDNKRQTSRRIQSVQSDDDRWFHIRLLFNQLISTPTIDPLIRFISDSIIDKLFISLISGTCQLGESFIKMWGTVSLPPTLLPLLPQLHLCLLAT